MSAADWREWLTQRPRLRRGTPDMATRLRTIGTAAGAALGLCVAVATADAGVGVAGTQGRAPAEIVEAFTHRASGVVTLTLDNGVRVHWKHVPTPGARGGGDGDRGADEEGRVAMRVVVFGGDATEPSGRRGIGMAATSAWRTGSVRSAPAGSMGARLSDLEAQVLGWSSPDALVMHVRCPVDSADDAADGVRRLLTEPLVEAQAVSAWLAEIRTQLETLWGRPSSVASDALVGLGTGELEGGWGRLGRMADLEWMRTPAAVGEAQRWLDGALATRPMEAAIVGDVSLADAVRLAERMFAGLPSRGAMTAEEHAALVRDRGGRNAVRGAGRGGVRGGDAAVVRVVGGGQGAIGMLLPGAARGDMRTHRALGVGGEVLRQRVAAAVRTAEAERAAAGNALDVEAIERPMLFRASSVPAGMSAYGRGVVLVTLELRCVGAGTDEAWAREVLGILEREIAGAASGGAAWTDEEIGAALERMAAGVETTLADPEYWATVLPLAAPTGVGPDELADAAEQVRSLTAEEVRRVWASHAGGGATARVLVLPRE